MSGWQCRLPAAVAALVIAVAGHAEPVAPRISIIIDDLGYRQAAGERAIALPGPVAYAVLPGTPRGNQLARLAHTRGKEVLLHLPLQAVEDRDAVEPGGLLLDMSRNRFRQTLADNLRAVPHIVGVNTHRGSLLTRHPGHMQWLMEAIADSDDLFFVDSYTTAQSVALRMAEERGIPSARRDVFLDPDSDPGTIEREFARLKQISRTKGYALGIGHPYPTTLDFLEAMLPRLAAEGFVLVPPSELIGGGPALPRERELAAAE